MHISSKKKLIIFTAPSGAGKTTLVRHLLAQLEDQLAFSISATTRAQRPRETNGKDYHFISKEDFRQKIDQQEFVEWEEVYDGHYYGTLKTEIERIWASNKAVIFDIDVKGAKNICAQYPDHCLSVFIKPPSIEALEKRLVARQTETKSSIQKRIQRADLEMTYEANFDCSIVNDDLEIAKTKVLKIVRSFLLA